MKKIIIKAFILLLTVCALSGTVSLTAAALEQEFTCSLLETDKVCISGMTLPGDRVTLIVLKKGVSFDTLPEFGVSSADFVYTVDTVTADETGSFSFIWQPSVNGDYDIWVVSDNTDAKKLEYFFMNGDDLEKLNNIILRGSLEELRDIFRSEITPRVLELQLDEYKNVSDGAAIGEMLYYIREELQTTEPLKYFTLACRLCAMSETPSDDNLEAVINEAQNVNWKLDAIDIYIQNMKTGIIRTALAERWASSVPSSLDNINSAFTEDVVLVGIEKALNWTSVQIYMQLVNNANYSKNKDQIAVDLVGKNFENMASLEVYLNSWQNTVKPSNSGSSSGSGSGSSSVGGSGSIAVSAGIGTKINTAEPVQEKDKIVFFDVSSQHWAFDSINYLRWNDILTGEADGNFYPERLVTRAEFLKMLCEAYGITGDSSKVFDDVSNEDWYAGYVAAAFYAGLISGYENKFLPDSVITREDAVVMLFRFADKNGDVFTADKELNFTDNDIIHEYALEAVRAFSEAGIIHGMDDGSFAPLDGSTRAQAAVMIYRVIQHKS